MPVDGEPLTPTVPFLTSMEAKNIEDERRRTVVLDVIGRRCRGALLRLADGGCFCQQLLADDRPPDLSKLGDPVIQEVLSAIVGPVAGDADMQRRSALRQALAASVLAASAL